MASSKVSLSFYKNVNAELNKFNKLLSQANKRANQLHHTVNQISNRLRQMNRAAQALSSMGGQQKIQGAPQIINNYHITINPPPNPANSPSPPSPPAQGRVPVSQLIPSNGIGQVLLDLGKQIYQFARNLPNGALFSNLQHKIFSMFSWLATKVPQPIKSFVDRIRQHSTNAWRTLSLYTAIAINNTMQRLNKLVRPFAVVGARIGRLLRPFWTVGSVVGNVVKKIMGGLTVTAMRSLVRFGRLVSDFWKKTFLGDKGNLVKSATNSLLGAGKNLAGKGLNAITNGAQDQQRLKDSFVSRAGDVDMGGALFERFRSNALATGQDVKQSLEGVLNFMPFARNTEELEHAQKLMARMAAMDPSGGGIEGASAMLRSAAKGDASDIRERFAIPAGEAEAIAKLGGSGDTNGMLQAIEAVMAKRGAGEGQYDAMVAASPLAQMEQLSNKVAGGLGSAGQTAFQALLPVLTMLNEAFAAGKFQPFFDMLTTGLSFAAYGIEALVGMFKWLFSLFMQMWPAISVLLMGLATVALPLLIANVLTLAGTWIIANLPVLLLAGIIGLIIYIVMQLGATVEQVVGTIVGTFYLLFAFLYNSVSGIWDYFLMFAEFLVNLFIDPIYSIQKLVYDLQLFFLTRLRDMIRGVEDFAGNFMKLIVDAINWVIDGINLLITALNAVLGKNINKVDRLDPTNNHAISDRMASMIDNMKPPESQKNVVDLSGLSMGKMDYGDAYNSGFDVGAKLGKKLSDGLGGLSIPGPSADEWSQEVSPWSSEQPDINRVNEVGSINDTVDISSEDLKLMRDLAEMQSIQNFVTLTPTVQVTTGDVRQEADIDTVIRRIEQVMVREIAASAKGVYA